MPFPKCSAVHIIIYSASCSHYQKKLGLAMNGQYDAVSDTEFNLKFKIDSVVCLYQLLTLVSLSQSHQSVSVPNPFSV